jgi:hypothetical protein
MDGGFRLLRVCRQLHSNPSSRWRPIGSTGIALFDEAARSRTVRASDPCPSARPSRRFLLCPRRTVAAAGLSRRQPSPKDRPRTDTHPRCNGRDRPGHPSPASNKRCARACPHDDSPACLWDRGAASRGSRNWSLYLTISSQSQGNLNNRTALVRPILIRSESLILAASSQSAAWSMFSNGQSIEKRMRSVPISSMASINA